MAQDPYKYFRPEARDLLDQFAKGVLDIEKNGTDAAAVQRLLRVAHTLKGAARVVKQSEIANKAHAIEDTLSPFRDGAGGIAREQIDVILAHLDDIGSHLGALNGPEPANQPVQRKSEPEEGPKTVRADVAEADAVLEGVAETHALLNGLRGTTNGMEEARHLAELLLAQFGPRAEVRQAGSGGNRRLAIAEDLCRKFAGLERRLVSSIDQMDRELRQLREAAERLRLVATGTLFTALERTARDSARALDKKVVFEGKGGDIRLDAHVLEALQGALIQIVRNAVAHGIETPSERTAAGKLPAGLVSVHITRRGRMIVFSCRDDGRGVDLEGVRRIATERGMLDRSGKDYDARDLMRILLRGGISTSATVTNVAGRGIGLDVVREGIERLGGEVVFHTERGKGTTIELLIPPSLASMEAIVIEAEGADETISRTSIPLDAVRSTLRVSQADITRGAPGDTIVFEQKAIPFIPLATALDGLPWSPDRSWTTLIVAGASGHAAIGVERLLGTSRIVARPLPQHLAASPTVASASLDSDGNPQLILDPEGLVAAAQRGASARRNAPTQGRPILVIDDSLTTRMLEQSILESAGYDVDVAVSAEQALEILRYKSYALILVDVEMPGMDGFSFIERIRSDPALRDTPAILVTSRVSPEDLQRGRDVGANAHIAKAEFDQAELLSMIKPMMMS
jgi:two-component system, chemotaxis family, sensor kinase CheA